MTRQTTVPDFRAIIGLLTIVFLVLTGLVAFNYLDAERRLADANYDSSGIAAVQLRLHYRELLTELALIENGAENASPAQALLRFDILYERVSSLPTRPPYDRFLTDEVLSILAAVQDALDREIPLFDAVIGNGNGSLAGTYGRLSAIAPDINRFAGKTLQLATEYRELRRGEIIQVTRLLIGLTAGLVVSGAVFAFLLWNQIKRYEVQNEKLSVFAEQLSEANNAKQAFLAHMSHELRTPLNAIIGFSETMTNGYLGKMENPKHAEYAQDIQLSARHLLELINDILDISRIEAGEEKLVTSEVDLCDLVETTLVLADPGPEIETIVSIPADFPRLRGDRRRLQQVLLNLVSNASKHTGSGGRIDIRSTLEDGAIVLSVKDNGAGMSPEDIEIALTPFGQVRASIDQTHEGTGLGLPLSQSLMELHGGRLGLESTLGEGTTVRMIFPVERTVAPGG